MRAWAPVVIVLALGLAAATPAARRAVPMGGAIQGHVTLPALPPDAVVTRPAVGDLGMTPHDPLEPPAAVIYLDPAPRPAFEELPSGRARMEQRHEQFIPHVLAITVGTAVDFPNNDTSFHNVFSLSKTKSFDLGRNPPGKSKSVLFDRPGIVPVSCDIHTHMSAFILVFNHPYFAVTGDGGRYRITGIPAGTYTLRAFYETVRLETRAITVTDGATVEADFVLGRR